MKVGDYVRCTARCAHGLLIEDAGLSGYIKDAKGTPERVFLVAWDDGVILPTGECFMKLETEGGA